MAKASTKKIKTSPAGAATPRRPGAAFWVGSLGASVMIIVSPGTVILLAVLMLPVMAVALLPTEGAGGRVALTTLLFGLAASARNLLVFWRGEGSFDAAVSALRHPAVLLTAWTGVLCGWFISELAAMITRLLAELKASTDRRAINAKIATLEEEWGALQPITETPAIP